MNDKLFKLLVLGRGFIGNYVEQLCSTHNISCASTTRDGRAGTIKFDLPGLEAPLEEYIRATQALPKAECILVTFPLKGAAAVDKLLESYSHVYNPESTSAVHNEKSNSNSSKLNWILLGTTGVFTKVPSNRNTERDPAKSPERQESEDQLLNVHGGTVLYLSGLWGGARNPEGWMRFFNTEEAVLRRVKDRTLHLIHGEDVARAIVDGVVKKPSFGEKWIISDPECTDMLEIFVKHFNEDQLNILRKVIAMPEARKYVNSDKLEELIVGKEANLQRRLDPDEFWDFYNLKIEHKYRP
ncbi:hypothetical protein BB561_001181 [Smittium simulii]|uniref:Uncharacterized protein n=1 Tax=Smittium simulii TaxID=133385 RepID=A0A2T9YVR6_9FUNG|nr:hypothetical protein BB561_001181 [Smittium simulii]